MTTDDALEIAVTVADISARIPEDGQMALTESALVHLAADVRRLRESTQALIINCDRLETESAQWQSRALAAEEMLDLDIPVPVTVRDTGFVHSDVRYIDTGIVTTAASAYCVECASLREQLREASAVCACGHPDSDHEHYGEDGLTHDCEHDCIRVSPAVASVIASLREQIRLLREASSEQDMRLAGVEAERDELEAECERRAIETGLLRRERDALAKRVAELTAQRDTAYGYGQDGGEPPWMK